MKIEIPVNSTYHEINNEISRNWENDRGERYKEYRIKWKENPEFFLVEKAPLHLDIEPTSACNLRCPMCTRTVLLEEGSTNFKIETMSFENFKKVIDEATEIGVYAIKLNWMGEPLMHKNIVEMVQYAKNKGIVDVMLNTNAVLLDEKMSKNLIEAGLDKIFFSFDSPNKENYEKIRVGANYEQTLENIKSFVKIREELGYKTPLTRVSMVLMDSNKDEYSDYVKLFENVVDIVAYVEYIEPKSSGIKKEYNDGFACSQLWQRMVIAANGDVSVCCVDSTQQYIVGNVFKDGIENIWTNEKYKNIRKLHEEGKYNEVLMCEECELTTKRNSGTV